MTSPTTEPRTAQLYHGALDPPVAALVVAAAMGTFLVTGALAPAGYAIVGGQLGLLATALACGLVAVRAGAAPSILAALGLAVAGIRARHVAAALLLGGSAWYLNLFVVAAVHRALHVEPPAQLAVVVARDSLPVALVTLAIVPPVCEELVFRGIFARALGRRLPLAAACIGSAAVFSIYHLSVVQAAPTFVLGLALGLVALRADSILPAMLVHALNNAIAVLVARDELPAATAWIDRNPVPMTIGCAVASSTGIALLVLRD